VLMSFMLQIIFELFKLEWNEDHVRDFWIIARIPAFYTSLASRSKLLDAAGKLNNVAMNFFKTIHQSGLKGQVNAGMLQ